MSDRPAMMAARTDNRQEGYDWQLLYKIESGDPEYAIEYLTARGLESLKKLEAAKYVHIDGQIVTVTVNGLAALMPNYAFVYACELISLREQVAELAALADKLEGKAE